MATAETSTSSTTSTASPDSQAADPVSVKVHLTADDTSLALVREGVHGEAVCSAPCERTLLVVPGDQFHFDGDGITRSGSFPFQPRPGEVEFRVRTGRAVGAYAGLGLVALGGGGAFLASIEAAAGYFVVCFDCKAQEYDSKYAAAAGHRSNAKLYAAAGLGTMLVGAALVLLNQTTFEAQRR